MNTVLATGQAIWIVVAFVVVAAWPYAQLVKHERHAPLAAYLIFISVLVLCAAALFLAIMTIASATGLTELLSGWIAGMIVIAAILIPALLLARHAVRRPPRKTSPR